MTKAFTLPGLRIGYMVAPRAVTEAVAALQPSWSVSAPAQEAAIACLEEDVFLAESTARLRCVKHELAQMLCAAGFQVHAGEANFVLIDVGDAAKMRRRLLERGIAVRDCTSFGLPRHIRAGVRTLPECRNLVAALEEARDAR
jgi:histidinol-phosphate/aromatic aminotransferase/cobyric acid decarboxylase-like protein